MTKAELAHGKSRGVLAKPQFRRFFLGYTTSVIGASMAPLASVFAVLGTGGSASDIGLVMAAGVLPTVLFLLWGGVVADRFSRRTVILGSNAVCCLAQTAFALLVLFGQASLASILVIAAVRGAAAAFHSPALAALPTELVEPDELQRANSLIGLSKSVPTMAGPALAGALVAIEGPWLVLAIDAACYLLSVVLLATVRIPPRAVKAQQSILASAREGWAEFRSRRWLWSGVLQFAVWNMLVVAPFLVLGPVIADEQYGGPAAWGVIVAAQGAGSVAGGLLMLRWRVRKPLVTIAVTRFSWVAVMVFMALYLPVPVLVVAAFAVGLASGVFIVLWQTTEQRLIPGDVLARVSAFDLLGALGLGPLGLVLVGPVSEAVGIAPVLWFAAGAQVVSSVLILMLPEVRRITLDDAPAQAEQSGQERSTRPAT